MDISWLQGSTEANACREPLEGFACREVGEESEETTIWTALDWMGPREAADHHDANTAHEYAHVILRAGLATRLPALLAFSIAPKASFLFSVDRRIDTRFL